MSERPYESRRMVCRACGGEVDVYEEPVQFFDPARFTCVPCLDPRHAQLQLGAAIPTRTETRRYEPKQAVIPF